MSFNLIDAAKGLFTNELVGKASAYLGESENSVTKALTGIVPSLLGGLTEKATASHEGAVEVTRLAKESDNAGFLGNLGGFFDNGGDSLLSKGAGLLGGLFGEGKTNMLSSLISQFSGAKSSSITSLLSLAAPAILGMLGKHASSNNLDAGGLASMLSSQKSNIANALPAGLNLSSIFGGFGSKAAETVSHAANTTHHYATDTNEKSGGGMKLLFPIILLALLGAAAWYFFKDGCRKPEDPGHTEGTHTDSPSVDGAVTQTTVSLGKIDSVSGDFIYDLGESVAINLPNNGGSLTVGKNSTEYRLVNFLNDKNALIDTAKGNWFEFTNVRFKTGGSDITDESLAQLKNLVAIAKAYPSAKFKIGGYTDNTGDAAKNVALSQKRADAVAAKLKELGMAATGLESAKGYGQEWPIADNATPEGRAQNRRVAVNVKAK